MSSRDNSLTAAAAWIEQLLLGSFGTAVAMIGVALIGFALVTGRISIRASARTGLGCFVLFGAPLIAQGLLQLARGQGQSAYVAPPPAASAIVPPSTPQSNPDPYAGASVPM